MKLGKALERAVIAAALAGLIAVAHADDTTTLPPVKAVLSDLGEIVCYGYDCVDVLAGLAPIAPLFPLEYGYISPDAGAVSHEEFCQGLKDAKPEGCNGASPPSTPGTDPNWQPSGCGTNEWIQIAMDLGVNLLVPGTYSGDHNSPYAGVSFEAACNTHDACWGRDFDRGSCDMAFSSNMINACSVLSNPSEASACEGLAGFYFGVVASTKVGDYVHAKAVGELRCAMWTKDMVSNGCTE